jgi:hypothetical protein
VGRALIEDVIIEPLSCADRRTQKHETG